MTDHCFSYGWEFTKQDIASLLTLSLIADGRLCILPHFLYSVFTCPSALSSGLVPRHFLTINCFQCIVKLHHGHSDCKRLDSFCFLAQPGILHIPLNICIFFEKPLHHFCQTSLGFCEKNEHVKIAFSSLLGPKAPK